MLRPALILVCMLGLVVGCSGDNRPKRVPVSGVVKYEGKPVAGADVVFRNEKAPRFSVGKTDSDGKYQLTTFEEGDGAIPGTNVVTVIKISNAPKPVTDLTGPGYAEAMKTIHSAPKSEIPLRYNDSTKPVISKTITPDGPQTVDLELTDE